ncbi:MAG TPA: EAL domain-containing protein [Epsilonproteobacteria bacterium]|nr:EAL domain-containing protein [Campylobacterota bacterium]
MIYVFELMGRSMTLDNILRCGYTFTPEEYELETKYVMTTAFMLIVATLLSIITVLFYSIGDEINALLHAIGTSLSFVALVLSRIVGKDNYQKLAYIMMLLFTLLIMYSYTLIGDMYPISAWIVIQILASFLVLDTSVAIVISIIYFLFFSFMPVPVEYPIFSFIFLKIIPVFVALVLIYLVEKKFNTAIISLENANKLLEERVSSRTKDIEAEKLKLDHQAHYDFLTDLPNRNKFHKEIQEWIQRHAEQKTQFSLFFIDLDRFKRVNDSLGHNAGDKVLKIIASGIKMLIDEKSFVARISGDEFTLLFEHENNAVDAVKALANNIILEIEKSIILGETKLYISASIGISCYPHNAQYYEDLIQYADTTMFEAKVQGRGTYKFYDEKMTHRVKDMVLMETEIYDGIKRDEFMLSFQPQVDIRTEKISGMEILVRWQHPKLGFCSPNDFIPLAEETGAIIALDHYILEKGMEQTALWKRMGYEIPRISFNFSTKHLHQKGFVAFIEELLVKTSCKGEWIELEITESHIVANIEESIVVLNALKSLGITIAIDDFGTGYSSLTYLKKLPADKLKIDKSFIEKILDNHVDMTITKAIIEIGNSLKLTVIAEGVETEVQKEYLHAHACYHVQGHYYYESMLVAEIEEKGIFQLL